MPNMVLRVSRLWWAGLLFMVPPPRHCGISAAPPPPPAPSHSSNPPVSLDSTAQGDCDPESWTIPTRALGLDTTEGRAEAVRRVAWSKAALEAAVTAGDPVVFKDVPLSHLNWTPERLATALPAVQCFVQPRDNAVFRYWSKSAILDPDFTLPPQPPEQIVPAADFFAAVGSPSSSVRLYASGPLEEVLSPALRAEAAGAEELFSVADPMRRYAQGSKANGKAGQGDGREAHVGTNRAQSSEHEGLHKAEHLGDPSGINNHTGEPADRLSDAATSGGGGEGTEWRAETLTSVWFGGGGVTAAMHYDTTFNVHATLSGTKRYTLAHPRYHVEGLFPSLHPHYRQLRMEGVAALVNQGKAVEIEVKPGEALYLPPFWFHQVVSASEAGTVSISFWSESAAYWVMEEAFTLGIPFEEEWGEAGLRGAAARYLQMLARHLGESGERAFTGLRRRWPELADQDTASMGGRGNLCGEFPETRETALLPRSLELASLFKQLDPAPSQIYLGNFAEHLAYRIVGDPAAIPAFLARCVLRQPDSNEE